VSHILVDNCLVTKPEGSTQRTARTSLDTILFIYIPPTCMSSRSS